jgi:prepilin-type N-terminal cleavage/methylation domain-containing protein/prepilin-type processing-associated H-X9-DG protein
LSAGEYHAWRPSVTDGLFPEPSGLPVRLPKHHRDGGGDLVWVSNFYQALVAEPVAGSLRQEVHMNRSRCHDPARRRGFTLVELLVVIAIIGVLIGLLMPAVQKIREAANAMSCQNNLRQIGIAFHSHHDQLGYFPTGGWDWSTPPTYNNGQPTIGAQQQAGWGFQILPYIEGDNTWKGGQANTDLGRILVAIGTPNSMFFCPSRRGPQTVPFSHPEDLGGMPATFALCDYAASNDEGTGVVRQFTPTRIADITDGTSNTVLVGDKRLNRQYLGQPQKDDDIGYTAGWDNDTMRRTDVAPLPDYSAPSGDGGGRFGSSHTGRFNMVFADGSVHSITYSIDTTVFSYLGNKGDGQAFDSSAF